MRVYYINQIDDKLEVLRITIEKCENSDVCVEENGKILLQQAMNMKKKLLAARGNLIMSHTDETLEATNDVIKNLSIPACVANSTIPILQIYNIITK